MLASWTKSWVRHTRGNGRRCWEAGIRLWKGPGRDAGVRAHQGPVAGAGGPGCPASAVCRGCVRAGSAAVASAWPGSGQLRPRAGAREEGGDFADGGFLGGGFGQREVRLDLAAVAAAVFVLDHVAGCGQVGDDAVRAALGDVQARRDVARPRPGRGRCAAAPGRGRSGSSGSSPLRTHHYFQNFIASFQLQM
jgi:hypothetical protein